jgi:hypothetical protein
MREDAAVTRTKRLGSLAWVGALLVAGLPLVGVTRPVIAPPPSLTTVWPEADYDAAIPTTKSILGFEIGREMARHDEVTRYFESLSTAAPERMKIFEYGESWEGRKLIYGVISSPKNIARLDDIKAAMQRLSDPRKLAKGEAEALIRDNPAVVWLAYSVHGNEPGTTDAALMTAYHLLAARGDTRVPRMLDETLVVILPLQNPDGRERFINSNQAARGLEPDPSPLSAERDEPWPGGRMNHYIFDMNRDWFTQTQPEMRAHVATLLEWMPVVVADVHEMGTNQTYFFPPEADPLNPNLTSTQLKNVERIARNHATWFDQFGLRYFNREIFDGFFPGYGSGWPNYQGASAMEYEQGSSRGLVAQRSDGSLLHFADTVKSQFIASLSTIEVVASNRAQFLRDFLAFRASAVNEGQRETIKSYVIRQAPDADMASRLARTLARNGIEVRSTTESFAACGQKFDAGTYVVSAAQPTKRLIRTLLDEKTPMDAEFVKRQEDRVNRGLPDEIYDVTAWSLPLMFNVPVVACNTDPLVQGPMIDADWRLAGAVRGGQSAVGFVVPWGSTASVRFLTAGLRAGLAIKSANKSFSLAGVEYPAGSLFIDAAVEPAEVATRVKEIAQQAGVQAVAVEESWVDAGISLGSPNMLNMPTPRIALAWDAPTDRYSAGHARFVLERQFGYPVTLVRTRRLTSANLDGIDVLVLPGQSGSYASTLGKKGAENLKSWVERGGVLIALGSGTRYLSDAQVELLPLKLESAFTADSTSEQASKKKPSAKPESEKDADSGRVAGTTVASVDELEAAERPLNGPPRPVAGVLARATVEPEHWLAAGVQNRLHVLVTGNDIYTPVRRDEADTVARFAAPDDVLASGVLWEENRKQLAFKPFVVSKRSGRGLVIGFTADPNFRAHMAGLNLIFMNAIFRGAAMTYEASRY